MARPENSEPTIGHVTDTALWVAVYRAEETKRPDALFRDPLAAKLVGSRGYEIESKMSSTKYVKWSLVMRTLIIDGYVERAIREGFDTVVNLGAGLDTRPYRMDLPPNLQWIEVDFPQMIEYKANVLKHETPRCRLERIAADLSVAKTRQEVLAAIAARSRKALVITEGVILYLQEENVAELADELHAHPQFQYWVTEYFHPIMRKYIDTPQRQKEMARAPMVFWPADWWGFFAKHRWEKAEVEYIHEVSQRVGRPIPMPAWARMILAVLPFKPRHPRYVGYVLWKPSR